MKFDQERICTRCDSTYTGPFSVCWTCIEKTQATIVAEGERQAKEEAKTTRVNRWIQICPPAFQSTAWKNKEDFPRLSPLAEELGKTWWPEWNPCKGLGMYGVSGVGKTRAAWNILKRLHFAGVDVEAIDSMNFAKAAADQFADRRAEKDAARDLLNRARRVNVLLLDDLGKEPYTPRVAAELHDLLEMRIKYRRPLIWTSERTGTELAEAVRGNYADGILRRIREMTIIHPITDPTAPTA